MKKTGYFFLVLSLILSHMMCVVVAYNYRDMLCGIAHSCYSAPAYVAFIHLIPYGLAIVICGGLSWYFIKREKHTP